MYSWMIFILSIIVATFAYAIIVTVSKEITIQKLCKGKTTEEIKIIIAQYTVLESNRNKR